MKYVALLSGGKDSCYNLVHCQQNGHELVAAASLGPGPGKEELDSYMYQTVGQDAIEFVARALEVPLFRQIITGSAIEQGSEYGGRSATNAGGIAGDETEDLYTLLVAVKSHHPDLQGVSVGAILSNYQRVRVEHVCRRLGLTPLCYLWQRDQGELLSEMIEGGMEVVLIKVAGIGLTASHLGNTLAEMQPTLMKLNKLYGSHICGEGGEYESLTLDCPVFKHRINLVDTEIVIHSDSGFATVAFLRINRAELVSKSTVATNVTIPPYLEGEYESVKTAVEESEKLHSVTDLSSNTRVQEFQHPEMHTATSQRVNSWLTISNVESRTPGKNVSIQEEVIECFQILAENLADHGLQLSHCTIINICLSSMDLFASVNAVYSTFFGVSPPARACVGVDLPEGIRVRLECTAFAEKSPADRHSLHVQGLSYWAPANIGPYSQAVMANERVFISGQIGLMPSHLILPSPRSLAEELALASQHVARITSALKENSGGGWDSHVQLTIYWATESSNLPHIKRGHNGLQLRPAPTLFLVVKGLPKGALVEKQVVLHTGRCQIVDEDGESAVESCTPTFEIGSRGFEDGAAWRWEVSNLEEDNSSCTVLYLKGDFVNNSPALQEMAADIASILPHALSVRYFYTPKSGGSLSQLSSLIFGQGMPPTTSIPSRSIGSMDRDDWDVAFCILSSS